MLFPDLLRQALKYEIMQERLLNRQPLLWRPPNHLFHEVYKRRWYFSDVDALWDGELGWFVLEEELLWALALVEEMAWWRAEGLLKHFYLLLLAASREQRRASKYLIRQTPGAPHVDFLIIGFHQHDFWWAIVSWLYVSKLLLVDKARRPKVNKLDTTLSLLLEDDILGFDIAMYNLLVM